MERRGDGRAVRRRWWRMLRHRRPACAEQSLTFGEKLIRNSAVACALLLTVMAIRNLDEPWSRQMTEGVRSALTMRLDWDHTLGRLSFVRALVPDTALVFLNLGEEALPRPAEGEVLHPWSEAQPWLEFACNQGEAARCVFPGRVSAVGQGPGGDWVVQVEGDGGSCLYGYLSGVSVSPGEAVTQGQALGVCGERLYFDWRDGTGQRADPSGRMGL